MTEYKFHEFANLFPLLEGNEFAELVADIRANGLYQKITLCDGKILDGRNRYRACLEGGTEPRLELFNGSPDKALNYVISQNLKRRHLDASQRAMIAARIATLGHGQHQSGKFAALPTQAKAAEMLNVGERSVRSARVVLNKGTPELISAVDSGKITVSPASAIARQPETKQREAVATGPKAIVAAAKQSAVPKLHVVAAPATSAEDLPRLTPEQIIELKGAQASLITVNKRISQLPAPTTPVRSSRDPAKTCHPQDVRALCRTLPHGDEKIEEDKEIAEPQTRAERPHPPLRRAAPLAGC